MKFIGSSSTSYSSRFAFMRSIEKEAMFITFSTGTRDLSVSMSSAKELIELICSLSSLSSSLVTRSILFSSTRSANAIWQTLSLIASS